MPAKPRSTTAKATKPSTTSPIPKESKPSTASVQPPPSSSRTPQIHVPLAATFHPKKLDRTPERVLRFLRSLNQWPALMQQLVLAGYSEEEHEYAWELLHQISAYRKPSHALAEHQKQAVAQLDAWDEPNFRRASAALKFRYPDQHAFLFQDLKAEQGDRAILSVRTFLDRVEILEKGTDPKRQHTAPDDQAAVALLHQRKILSKEILALLREWLKAAQSLPDIDPIIQAEQHKAAQQQILTRLAIWYEEWSETARTLQLRRSYQISLGIAKRRPSQTTPHSADDADEDDVDEDDNNESDTPEAPEKD